MMGKRFAVEWWRSYSFFKMVIGSNNRSSKHWADLQIFTIRVCLEVVFLVEKVGSKSRNIDPLRKYAQQNSATAPSHLLLNEELAVFVAYFFKKNVVKVSSEDMAKELYYVKILWIASEKKLPNWVEAAGIASYVSGIARSRVSRGTKGLSYHLCFHVFVFSNQLFWLQGVWRCPSVVPGSSLIG